MRLNHRDRHNVEDAASVGVFQVRKFLVAPAFVVRHLDIPVYLSTIGAFEERPIFAMRNHDRPDTGVGYLLFCHLSDVECFFIRNVKLRLNLRDHVLNRHFHRHRACAFLSPPGSEFHRAAARH